MASRGTNETESLKRNLTEQLDRLVTQLSDLETSKDDLDADEYEAMKQETKDQLIEFSTTLEKMNDGKISLVDDINRMQLAIQASISEAFKTPDIIRFFTKKQPGQLRNRLGELERDFKVAKLTAEDFIPKKIEILAALSRLGEALTDEEKVFMEANATGSSKEFALAKTSLGDNASAMLTQHLTTNK